MDYEAFIKANLGKAVEAEDSSNYAQCFDWAFAYCDFLKVPREAIRHLNAYQIWTGATDETRKYFDLIPNTPDGIPQKGDLVIFSTVVGPAGHVCIADGNGDTNSFQSTDQNWNGHSYVEYIWHKYNGVLGWLRPKNQPEETLPVLKSDFTNMREKCDKYDLFHAAGYTTIDDVTKKVTDLTKQNQNYQTDIQTLQRQIVDLADEVKKIKNEDISLSSEVIDAQHQRDQAQSDLKAICDALGCPTNKDLALSAVKTLKTPHEQVVKQVQPLIENLADAAIKKKKPVQKPKSWIRVFLHL